MSYFDDIYKKRVNRFGTDYPSRLQGEREHAFKMGYLKKSVYRIDFLWEGYEVPATFEPYRQNDTKNLHYLLTEVDINLPEGTMLYLPDHPERGGGNYEWWMVYYRDEHKATGYNRYIMLRMNRLIEWIARDGSRQQTYAYLYGQEDNMLKDELKSRSRSHVLYNENLKLSFFVCPINKQIKKEDYITISTVDVNNEIITEGYRVTGYDIISSEGVEYVSIDPIYLLDESPVPHPTPEQEDNPEFFWLKSKEYHTEEKVGE